MRGEERPSPPHIGGMMITAMPRPTSPDPRTAWKAVTGRDASEDGRFVFAVVTTGVYCRPSCAARRPNRENVRFFAGPGEADSAGFRACLRCKPATTEPPAAVKAVQRAVAFLETHADEAVPLATLARATGLSAFHLQRTFKKLVGVTPKRYILDTRLRYARFLVENSSMAMTAIAFETGFADCAHFSTTFRARFGVTPRDARAGGSASRR